MSMKKGTKAEYFEGPSRLKMKKRLFITIPVLFMVAATLMGVTSVNPSITRSQLSDQAMKARALMAAMTPEEKVGQLFLVSFKGMDTSEKSQIYDLVTNRQIGGVILSSANDNFSGAGQTIADAYALTSSLQSIALSSAVNNALGSPSLNLDQEISIPLFIAISQEGDQYPYDQILSGMTPLPDEMSIGATWNTELAAQVGGILGKELHALGFNMIIGPSLDVLDVVQPESGEDLGTRTFGGDPYWTSLMSQAYIRGLHQGSQSKLVVIAKHFPGRGGSDRPPEDEVATVRKSLESLKQIELAPFFSVTGNAPDATSVTDGLLVSHIRYQGFQGNIRATTRPVSFDAVALQQILALAPFESWRQNGGIIVSDNLGSKAVRRFFDPAGQSFDARQVARNAFFAGNDLLIVDNFIGSGDADSYSTIIRTLDFFTQKYEEDLAFAEKVDQSVERLLTLKYEIYSNFEASTVISKSSDLAIIGQSQQVTFNVARQSVSLISPSVKDLTTVLPRAPELNERIVFITDTLEAQQCSLCKVTSFFPMDGLENIVLRLYGPEAANQVTSSSMASYGFTNLARMLNDPGTEPDLASDLQSADWVVVSMLNVSPMRLNSDAFKRFLDQKYEVIQNKKIIVFAFNAPYYLDSTDISKLTAYYGIYSKSAAFMDVAARILFQELTPLGSLPVSVAGIGYDLITALSPDPTQIITIQLDIAEITSAAEKVTPSPTAVPSFFIGDALPLRTGIIRDQNGHAVPDGTVVRFQFTVGGDQNSSQQMETTTTNGIARTSYELQTPGVLEIRVSSDPATVSEVLRLEIAEGQAAIITAIAPTPITTPAATFEGSQSPTPQIPEEEPSSQRGPGIGLWSLTLAIILAGVYGIFRFGERKINFHWGIRWGITSFSLALIAYLYPALDLPGTQYWDGLTETLGVVSISVIGLLIGWGIGWIWYWVEKKSERR
jgi:beta-N-acetylhexosaminidase